MAFPTSLTEAVDRVTKIIAEHLNALEAKVGIDSSTVATSLDYIIKSTSSINPGHRHSKLYASDGSPESITVNAVGKTQTYDIELRDNADRLIGLPATGTAGRSLTITAGAASDGPDGGDLILKGGSDVAAAGAGGSILIQPGTGLAYGTVRITGLTTYANNTLALAGGLVAGDIYCTATGELMITYTP